MYVKQYTRVILNRTPQLVETFDFTEVHASEINTDYRKGYGIPEHSAYTLVNSWNQAQDVQPSFRLLYYINI